MFIFHLENSVLHLSLSYFIANYFQHPSLFLVVPLHAYKDYALTYGLVFNVMTGDLIHHLIRGLISDIYNIIHKL
jgi:hypothetical protein